MGSLLSLMIQGRKIEFRFGGVRLFLPGSYKALASFSTRDVDRWVSTIQPRYLFARQPTPDLRFNQKPFDVPMLLCIYDSGEGPILPSNCTP